jgi:hypothetical protein
MFAHFLVIVCRPIMLLKLYRLYCATKLQLLLTRGTRIVSGPDGGAWMVSTNLIKLFVSMSIQESMLVSETRLDNYSYYVLGGNHKRKQTRLYIKLSAWEGSPVHAHSEEMMSQSLNRAIRRTKQERSCNVAIDLAQRNNVPTHHPSMLMSIPHVDHIERRLRFPAVPSNSATTRRKLW